MITENISPIEASSTGTISSNRIGDNVTKQAPSRNSHGGKCGVAGGINSFRRGCFSCGVLTQTTENCRTLDESFPFLPMGWQAERVGDQFILGPGSPAGPKGQQTGNDN